MQFINHVVELQIFFLLFIIDEPLICQAIIVLIDNEETHEEDEDLDSFTIQSLRDGPECKEDHKAKSSEVIQVRSCFTEKSKKHNDVYVSEDVKADFPKSVGVR